ncbi:MAG: NAD(P)H-dependent oxidoreductase subunit E [Sulfurospirillum sp.]|nr:NAD(P)H-dependent oxidoreductase subunit E [Sulfurospirillum sp.]
MSAFVFTPENEEKFAALLQRYPQKSSLTLPSLWMVQYQEGFISEDAIVFLAKKLETTPMNIYSVASFYTMFNLKPVGKYHIQICKTLSCMLRGSQEIKKHIENRLGIKAGENTKDMKFTLTEVECLGSCGSAPCMSLNEAYKENLTIEKIDAILDSLA